MKYQPKRNPATPQELGGSIRQPSAAPSRNEKSYVSVRPVSFLFFFSRIFQFIPKFITKIQNILSTWYSGSLFTLQHEMRKFIFCKFLSIFSPSDLMYLICWQGYEFFLFHHTIDANFRSIRQLLRKMYLLPTPYIGS